MAMGVAGEMHGLIAVEMNYDQCFETQSAALIDEDIWRTKNVVLVRKESQTMGERSIRI